MNPKLVAFGMSALLLTQSCSEDSIENLPPAPFTISTATATSQQIELDWTDAVDPEGAKVTYSVYLDSEAVASNLAESQFVIKDLEAETAYEIKIIAVDEAGNRQEVSQAVSTGAVPTPTFSTLTVSDTTTTGFTLAWEASVEDNSTLTYDVYLDGKAVATDLTDTSYTFTELTPSTTYGVEVISESAYGTTASMEETVFTKYVQLSFGESNREEDTPIAEADLGVIKIPIKVMNEQGGNVAAGREAQVAFTVGGDVDLYDYTILTPSPIIIPQGSTEGIIRIEVTADQMIEVLDEALTVDITTVQDAEFIDEYSPSFVIENQLAAASKPSPDGYMIDITWSNEDENIDAILMKQQGNVYTSAGFYTSAGSKESFLLSGLNDGSYYLNIERQDDTSSPVQVSVLRHNPGMPNSRSIRMTTITLPAGVSKVKVYDFTVVNGEYTFK